MARARFVPADEARRANVLELGGYKVVAAIDDQLGSTSHGLDDRVGQLGTQVRLCFGSGASEASGSRRG